jgi:hypothetical protein
MIRPPVAGVASERRPASRGFWTDSWTDLQRISATENVTRVCRKVRQKRPILPKISMRGRIASRSKRSRQR